MDMWRVPWYSAGAGIAMGLKRRTMAIVSEQPALGASMRTVRNMLDTGAPFERAEAYVESCRELDEEERAVLWLYAWSRVAEPSEMARTLGRTV